MVNFALLNLKNELCKLLETNENLIRFMSNTKKKFNHTNDEWVLPWLKDRAFSAMLRDDIFMNKIMDITMKYGYNEDNSYEIVKDALSKTVNDYMSGEKEYGF